MVALAAVLSRNVSMILFVRSGQPRYGQLRQGSTAFPGFHDFPQLLPGQIRHPDHKNNGYHGVRNVWLMRT